MDKSSIIWPLKKYSSLLCSRDPRWSEVFIFLLTFFTFVSFLTESDDAKYLLMSKNAKLFDYIKKLFNHQQGLDLI